MILGSHFSIAGGLYKALDSAHELDCNALQIFIRSPRNFKTKILEQEDVDLFCAKRQEYAIKELAVHAVYTQNLATWKEHFHRQSIDANISDLMEASRIKANHYVLHLGSYKETTLSKGLSRIVEALKELSAVAPKGTNILLENISGSKNQIGGEFEQLAKILDDIGNPENVGICLDTCHAWAYGYDIKSEEGLNDFVKNIESTVTLDRVQFVHLNDSKEPFNSKHDRHSNIGEGTLGKEGIAGFINHPKLRHLPFVLETPKKKEDDDKNNLDLVRSLRK